MARNGTRRTRSQRKGRTRVSKRRVTTFFCMEYWHGCERVLLEKSGNLPTTTLPSHLSPEGLWSTVGTQLLGSQVWNSHQIGSVSGPSYDLFVVMGDIVHPAQVQDLHDPRKPLMWTPKEEIVKFRTLQSFILALCMARLVGWHLYDDQQGTEFKLSFQMQIGEALQEHPDPPLEHAPRLGPIKEEMKQENV